MELLEDGRGDGELSAAPTATWLGLAPTRPGVWPGRPPSPAPWPWWPCWCTPGVPSPWLTPCLPSYSLQ